jgi:integrase
MFAIRVKDADLDRNEITLRAQTTKSGKTRTVPISTQRMGAVMEWFRADDTGQLRPGHAPLIRNRFGKKIGSFRTTWETTVLRADTYRRKASPPAIGRPTV